MPLAIINILSFVKLKKIAITSDIGQQGYFPFLDGTANLMIQAAY